MARLDPYPVWSLYCIYPFFRKTLQSPPRWTRVDTNHLLQTISRSGFISGRQSSLYAKACHFVRPRYRSDLSFLPSRLAVYFWAFIEVVTSLYARYDYLTATDNCQGGTFTHERNHLVGCTTPPAPLNRVESSGVSPLKRGDLDILCQALFF